MKKAGFLCALVLSVSVLAGCFDIHAVISDPQSVLPSFSEIVIEEGHVSPSASAQISWKIEREADEDPSAPSEADSEVTEPTVSEETERARSLPTEDSEISGEGSLPLFTKETYPKVDGSTATIPLARAFQTAFTGEDPGEITHSKTHEAYLALINGDCDLILTVDPSEDELAMAEACGVELQFDSIVNEGFVFFVNDDNPVETLTANQIRNIYAGRITNWSEVGGCDEEIIAYQRPVNSGSQTGMLDIVMNGRRLQEAPTKFIMQSMSDIVDVVSNYENSRQAIGYSYYYYANTMYIGENCRMIRVNNIAPNTENFISGRYPFMTHYVAVTRKNDCTPETEALIGAMLSDRGQKAAAEAGYVPLRPMTTAPGTAADAPDKRRTLALDDLYAENAAVFTEAALTYRNIEYGCPVLDGLRDDATESIINEKIDRTIRKLIDLTLDETQELQHPETLQVTYHIYSGFANTMSLSLSVYAQTDSASPMTVPCEHEAYLNLDISTGSEIGLYDLFTEDVKAADVFSGAGYDALVSIITARQSDEDEWWQERVTDYAGIEEYEMDLFRKFNDRYPFDFYFTPKGAMIIDSVQTIGGETTDVPFDIRIPVLFAVNPDKVTIYDRYLTADPIFDGHYEALSGIPVCMDRPIADRTIFELGERGLTDVIMTDVFDDEASQKLFSYGEESARAFIAEKLDEAASSDAYVIINGRSDIYEKTDAAESGEVSYALAENFCVWMLDSADTYEKVCGEILAAYRGMGQGFEAMFYGSNAFIDSFMTYDPATGERTDTIEEYRMDYVLRDGVICEEDQED